MPDQKANWTIMVYISADSVLANFAVESLKQLKRAAGNRILVAAQVEGNGHRVARRYIFNGTTGANSSIEDDEVKLTDPLPSNEGIADPKNLSNFIEWVSKNDKCAANHHCLFPWTHGYELLLSQDQSTSNSASDRHYLTPKNLKQALQGATLKPDIVGIDACSMSLIELATELHGCCKYMIASQDDVPDASFPYEEMLAHLREHDPDDVEGICALIPNLYQQAYQDYIIGSGTGINEFTLTSLRVAQVTSITDPLKRLADALKAAVFDSRLRSVILNARKSARDFALGLFVDLEDFCLQLGKTAEGELQLACNDLRAAIDARGPNACVLENQTNNNETTRCHGLSIYFPYLAMTELDQVQKSMTAGQTTLVDQLPMLVKGGTNHLIKARGVKIDEIEKDFEHLLQFKKTGWLEFVRYGWSFVLAATEPNALDQHSSAQQVAKNLASFGQDFLSGDGRHALVLDLGPERREVIQSGPAHV